MLSFEANIDTPAALVLDSSGSTLLYDLVGQRDCPCSIHLSKSEFSRSKRTIRLLCTPGEFRVTGA